MSLPGRIVTFFPALQLMLCVACVAVALVWPPVLIAVPIIVYMLPLAAFRIANRIRPLREGLSYLDAPAYSAWWGSHHLQRIFIAIPQLESILILIPGAFSLWLRLWGSRIGRRVHWTPRVEVVDRSFLVVGDDVVVGHKAEFFAHAIKPSHGRLILYVRPIHIGARAFLGAGVRVGPGVRIEEDAFVPTLTDLYVNAVAQRSIDAAEATA